jgi:hypothetical protein
MYNSLLCTSRPNSLIVTNTDPTFRCTGQVNEKEEMSALSCLCPHEQPGSHLTAFHKNLYWGFLLKSV